MMSWYKILSVLAFFAELISGKTRWRSVSSHRSWAMLNQFECGISFTDRIIGGTNAGIGQFPWIVRLGYIVEPDEQPEWLCGGTLVTNLHVVTAAHCTINTDSLYILKVVRLGEYDVRTNPDCSSHVCASPTQDIRIARVQTHSNFNNPMFHNDIAVIVLSKPAVLSAFVMPVCLPKRDEINKVAVGDVMTVAGWGKTNITTDERANILQFVQIPIVAHIVCEGLNMKNFIPTKAEICAGAQLNKDACGGDSGGPLMQVFATDEGPKTFLMGVVSFGPTMCGIRKPGVYASVSNYLEWILDNLY